MNNGNGSALMKVVHASSNLENIFYSDFLLVGACVHTPSN